MNRDDAIKILNTIKMLMCRPDGTPISDGYEAVDMAIEALQAVPNCQKCAIKELWEATEKEDLVSVVRCKDCKHGEKQKTYEEGEFYSCDFSETEEWFTDDFFCANGERREP